MGWDPGGRGYRAPYGANNHTITYIHTILLEYHVIGTSSVFQPQKDHAYQGKSARVFYPALSLASVRLQSGCLCICLPLLITAKVILPFTHVLFWEASGLSNNNKNTLVN